MASLEEYATHRFRAHRVRADPPNCLLRSHTIVAQVIGEHVAREVGARLRHELPGVPVSILVVEPNETTLIPHGNEDPEGVIDLPRRRPTMTGILVAVAAGAGAGVIFGWDTHSFLVGLIVGCFAAVLGAVVGALVGGMGRYAGDRAWEQASPHGAAIGLVALFLDDERSAIEAAATIEALGEYDVRVVGSDGAWHVPST